MFVHLTTANNFFTPSKVSAEILQNENFDCLLDEIIKRRIKYCSIWLERWRERKNDWNTLKKSIKESIELKAFEINLSEEKKSEMLKELSQEIIRIRVRFEDSLQNALDETSETFLAKLEKENRQIHAKVLNLKDEGRISQEELINTAIFKILETIGSVDSDASNFLIRQIASIETEIGEALLDLFEEFIKNLGPDSKAIKELQNDVDHTERIRNKVRASFICQPIFFKFMSKNEFKPVDAT